MKTHNQNWKFYIWILWSIIMLCGGLLFLVSLKIKMPHEQWLMDNLSTVGAIFLFLIFGVCFVILAIPQRSQILNYITGTMCLVIAFTLKVSMIKAPVINSIILFLIVLSFIITKSYYRRKQDT